MTEIPVRVRQLLAELATLPHGATQTFQATSRSRGTHISGRPQGEATPPHEELEQAYRDASSDRQRAAVVDRMRATLKHWRGQGRTAATVESKEKRDARIVSEGEGWEVQDVAVRFRCTPTAVRRARLAAGRTADLGRATAATRPPVEDRSQLERARELRANGMSFRQVEMLTGVPRSTLHDAGRRDAA
jgi:hypothetical protein